MPSEDYQVVQDEAGLEKLLKLLEAAPVIAVDLETEGFDYNFHQIVGWALSTRPGQGFYVPVRHVEPFVNLDPDLVVERLRPILEDPAKRLCAHNAKFDTRFLQRVGIADTTNTDRWWSSDLMAFVAGPKKEPRGLERFGLKELELAIWKVRPVTYESLFPPKTKKEDMLIARIDPEIAGWYASADADYCLRLYLRYHDLVFNDTIYKLESLLWPVVQKIEETGVQADAEYMLRAAAFLLNEAEKVKEIVYDQVELAVGERVEFDIGSPKQLGAVLYTRMGLPVKVKSKKTGAPSTDELALSELEKDGWTVARNILTFRSMRSRASQFKSLAEKVSSRGRVHTQYKQYGATSGRFSSVDPNLQNVGRPVTWVVIRADGSTYEVMVNPRDSFVAGRDFWLGEFDFSAIEFAIFMFLAREMSVVAAYERGEDVHKQTWADMYRVPIETVTDDQRQRAKVYNYLILYQGSGSGLSMRSNMNESEAEAAINRFYEVRPNAARWAQHVKDEARRTKKVRTVFGREQFVPEFFDPGRGAFEKALRASVNRIIQGTAADVQKFALVRCVNRVKERFPFELARMVLQTHDSQTWEVHNSISPDEFVPFLIEIMGKKLPNLPKIAVEAKLGVSWGNLRKWKQPGDDWETIFAEMRKAREEYVFDLPEPEAPSEPVAINLRLAEESAPSDAIPGRIVLRLNEKVTMDRAKIIPETLKTFPGENLVILALEDEEIPLPKARTSLSAKDVELVFKPLFPLCTAKADWGVLAAAVAS